MISSDDFILFYNQDSGVVKVLDLRANGYVGSINIPGWS